MLITVIAIACIAMFALGFAAGCEYKHRQALRDCALDSADDGDGAWEPEEITTRDIVSDAATPTPRDALRFITPIDIARECERAEAILAYIRGDMITAKGDGMIEGWKP